MIKEIEQADLGKALSLINDVFTKFVAVDYSQQGRETFDNYLKTKYDSTLSSVKSGQIKMWTYCENDKILGVIALRDISHLSLLFVDSNYHRKGIAKKLFRTALDYITKDPTIKEFTVNSSPYAVEVYKHLGFSETDKQQEKDGIVYVPMIMHL